ncbi:response regulator [Roseivirga echinicomitans]
MKPKEKYQVIIADDHQLVLDGFVSIINEMKEVEVVAAVNSGNEAIKIIEKQSIDLVITDIEMPEIDGISLLKLLKRDYPTIKVMMVSMYHEAHLIKQLIQLQVDGYILKSDDSEEWKQAIKNILRGKKYFSSSITQKLIEVDVNKKVTIDNLSQLTAREIEVLKLIAQGLSNKQIGEQLFISHKTVDNHRTNLMDKLDIHHVAGLVRIAMNNKLLE